VELDDLVDVHVAQTVAVGQRRKVSSPTYLANALDAAAGHGLFAGVGRVTLEVVFRRASVVTDLMPGPRTMVQSLFIAS